MTESASSVYNNRQDIPTQFGVHIGTDYATWNCGMSLCNGNNVDRAHIHVSYVGNSNSYNGQIGYFNALNKLTFITNKVNGMVLDSLGRLTLGSVTTSATSTLYVGGSSDITGNELAKGTISTNHKTYVLIASMLRLALVLVRLRAQSKQRI